MILVGATEIADQLGVLPATVHKWRHRRTGFPEPLATLAIGPVWDWEHVEAWALESGRL